MNEHVKAAVEKMYSELPEWVRLCDLVEACEWARETLTKHEGGGHHLDISANSERLMSCSFAKPSWSSDHSGSYMDSGSQAVVIAVVEYLCGA